MNKNVIPQPMPKATNNPALWDLVIKDMQDRDKFGEAKYHTRLQVGNGRDFLVDAYQEILDAAVYLRGLIFERDGE